MTAPPVDELIADLIGKSCDCAPHGVDQAGARLRDELAAAGVDVTDTATLEAVLRLIHRIGADAYQRTPRGIIDAATEQAAGRPWSPILVPPSVALNSFVGDQLIGAGHLLAHVLKARR